MVLLKFVNRKDVAVSARLMSSLKCSDGGGININSANLGLSGSSAYTLLRCNLVMGPSAKKHAGQGMADKRLIHGIGGGGKIERLPETLRDKDRVAIPQFLYTDQKEFS